MEKYLTYTMFIPVYKALDYYVTGMSYEFFLFFKAKKNIPNVDTDGEIDVGDKSC